MIVLNIGAFITVILIAVGVGYFLGTVENKREFMKNAANKLIPDKEVKVIDLKSELKREQEMQAADTGAADAEAKAKE